MRRAEKVFTAEAGHGWANGDGRRASGAGGGPAGGQRPRAAPAVRGRRRPGRVRRPGPPAHGAGARRLPAGAGQRRQDAEDACQAVLRPARPQGGDGALAAVGRQLALRDGPQGEPERPRGRRPAGEARGPGGRPGGDPGPRPAHRPGGFRRTGRGARPVAAALPRATGAVLPARADARRGGETAGRPAGDREEPARTRPQAARRRADAARRRPGAGLLALRGHLPGGGVPAATGRSDPGRGRRAMSRRPSPHSPRGLP